MSDPQLNNLIKMLDQIIANNLHYGDKVTDVAAEHLHRFWARSMKQQIVAHADQSPEELSELARTTVIKMKSHTTR
ncbi:formate dehydrogenase subunit delta [Marinobacter sp. 1-4A]|uniref:formate dehydrogenase subunit delta n=1 Tax=unclassified Marinobacter TaxID=83889 RepID=UPI00190417AB|nr:formate dehydrogenase subunit delta [Marinobacter sp. 1-4A]MBK1851427.1 formate dehydrogenase subunit delta [Marinobacter sp. 1-4A]